MSLTQESGAPQKTLAKSGSCHRATERTEKKALEKGEERGHNGDVAQLLAELNWAKVFDFCERLYSHLAQEVSSYNRETEELIVIAARSEVQKYIASELQGLFLEEHLAFEFFDGRG